jgi:signal transduction histidine kinase/CheY-like chemotaxis protein
VLALRDRIAKLEKINAVLIDRIESSPDQQPSAYSLFQTAIALERQVKLRSDDLTRTLRRVEQMNDQLTLARDIAERANRSKTQFLVQAGHDLFQPLNAAGIALSELAEIQHGDKGARLTQQIRRALSNIEQLLKTLLDISRLDAGIMLPCLETVSVGTILAELNTDYLPLAARHRLELRVRPTRLHVTTDHAMFIRILQNLVGNALRYTARGRVLVGVRRMQKSVRVDVIDTGPGIAQDQHALIFEEFRRGTACPQEGDIGLGLGLGLAIVQRLVNALEGHRISLRSEPGRGSCFSIELPRADPPPMPRPAPRRSPVSLLSDTRVAIIGGDNGENRALAELIRHWNCDVILAPSREAISRLGGDYGPAPDLLMLDHDEEASVLATVARFRAEYGNDKPAIVLVRDSGRPSREMAAAGIELLSKPVRPAELRALMSHLLKSRERLQTLRGEAQ